MTYLGQATASTLYVLFEPPIQASIHWWLASQEANQDAAWNSAILLPCSWPIDHASLDPLESLGYPFQLLMTSMHGISEFRFNF